jgi:hypothetical protein
MRHHSYNETAVEAWSVGCLNLGDILANLSNVQKRLMAWDYEEYGNVRKELSQFRQQLEEERTKCLYSGPSTEEHFIMNRLAKVLAREEIMEKQRVDWLKARGRNTSLVLVNIWQSGEGHQSEVHPIIQDIRVMSYVFSSFMVQHIKRTGNLATHICASKASYSGY